MTALIIVVLAILFFVADVIVRAIAQRMAAKRERAEREAVLKVALQLTFAEAKTLKRAEVSNPRARILAVDDEPVILDSFRKILVLAGYSVDTVESGPEALTLLRAHDYDLLFTDLKMPAMNGMEVVKAAHHLRPDVDVAVITGYGTIESAVETMQHGAVDFVQKPFTEEELVAIANRLLIKREARREAERRPTVRVVASAVPETLSGSEYCVPAGAFLSAGHAWVLIDPAGLVWTGLDDFARKALQRIDRIELPAVGTRVRRGDPLFALGRGAESARIASPVTGEVTQVNDALRHEPSLLMQSPYDRGWTCLVRPSELAAELQGLHIGQAAVAWTEREVERMRAELLASGQGEWTLPELEARFFGVSPAPLATPAETVPVG